MRRFTLILLCAVAVPGVAGEAAAPVFALVPEKIEVSALPSQDRATASFEVVNVSSSNVMVDQSDLVAGCGCSTLSFHPGELVPGARLPVELGIDLEGINGELTKSVLASIGGQTQRLKVRVKAVHFAELKPEALFWKKGERTTKEVVIRGLGDYTVERIDDGLGRLKYNLQRKADDVYAVELSGNDDESITFQDAMVKIPVRFSGKNRDGGLPPKMSYLTLMLQVAEK